MSGMSMQHSISENRTWPLVDRKRQFEAVVKEGPCLRGEQMLLVFPVCFVTSFHEGQITGLICLSFQVPHVVANTRICISLPHLLARMEHVLNHQK